MRINHQFQKNMSVMGDKTMAILLPQIPNMTIGQQLRLLEVCASYIIPKKKAIEISTNLDNVTEEEAYEVLEQVLNKKN